MCEVDWGLVADWITALTSAGVLYIAYVALGTWRHEVRGSAKLAASHEIVAAARALRYAFYAARSPLVEGWEFPETSRARAPNETTAEDYAHVFAARRRDMWPALRSVVDLRAKAGTVFGDAAADSVERLAKVARRLQFYMDEYVAIQRAGESVKQWTDQEHVKLTKQVVWVHEQRDDGCVAATEIGRGDLADLSKCVSSRIALDPRRSSSYDGAGRARDQD
jgi:hypothetical protein